MSTTQIKRELFDDYSDVKHFPSIGCRWLDPRIQVLPPARVSVRNTFYVFLTTLLRFSKVHVIKRHAIMINSPWTTRTGWGAKNWGRYSVKPTARGIPIHLTNLPDLRMAIANKIVPAARSASPGRKNTSPSCKRIEFTSERRAGFFSLMAFWPIACKPKVSAP